MQPCVSISASDFMQGKPHFITWTTEMNNRTWCTCYPAESPPFNLTTTRGDVDANGIWRACNFEGVFVDGLKVSAIAIEPDAEHCGDQSMIDTVKLQRYDIKAM